MGGFNSDGRCSILDQIISSNPQLQSIHTEYILDRSILDHYTGTHIKFDVDLWAKNNSVEAFHQYNEHPDPNFQRFLCSFSGSAHVSRKLLVAALNRMGWFDHNTCSKNFQFTVDQIDGHLSDLLDQDQHRFFRKFFFTDTSQEFFHTIYSFGHFRFEHAHNIHNLEHQLTSSFLHIVSETMATSYYPFVTEKFLYSVVTRGLFLAYAQPGWHDHLERYYGFRKYNHIFDYRFDDIQNPVERLIELMSMIAKFSVLSSDDWRDLYEMESDTIEYNYDHYFSKGYLRNLADAGTVDTTKHD
jgi:hypothetical protein